MKINPFSGKAFYISLLIAFLLIISLSFINIKLKGEIIGLKTDSLKLEENFKALKKNYEALKEENKALNDKSLSLAAENKMVQIEIEKTADRLAQFENTVKESVTWFKQNSNIENFKDYDKIKDELSECLNPKDKCRIDLTCIYEVNRKNDFRYTEDETALGKEDFLKDLSLIFDQKGGDCEDFSLLFKAEYNYLVNQCLLNFSRQQIAPIIEGKELDRTYMYVLCGVFDPGSVVKNWAGHCLVSLTEDPINKSSDIYRSIKDSILVEPQNGEFVANMSETAPIGIFDNGVAPNTLYYASMIITEDDLKIFYPYADKIEWIGYSDFLKNSKTIMEMIKK